jgi:hypothetical protein
MSGEQALLTRSWPVGERTVTLTIPRPKPGSPVYATAEWAPTEPSRLSTEEWKQYRLGRNEALAQLASELGISVAVLDL